MSTATPNLSLIIPEATDATVVRTVYNINWNLIDDIFDTVTLVEFAYLDGVTSAIQTQLNAKQALDAGLTSIAGLTTVADKMIYTTALDTYAVASLTAFGRTLIDDADASTARTTLGLAIGANIQAYDAGLTAIAALAMTDSNMLVGNGTTWVLESGATLLTSIGAAAIAQTMYIGTTGVAINRTSAALTLAGLTLTTPVLGTPTSGTLTNCDGTASGLTAGAVTNATLTTALTVNTGTLTLTAHADNDSVLTIGKGAVSVSGANTGDQSLAAYATLATPIFTSNITIGVAAGTTGSILLKGTTSGTVTLTVAAAAGTTTLALPAAYAAVTGYVLSSTDAGVLSWIAAGAGDALTTGKLSQFAATTSAELAGVISDETGTDKLVYNTSPTLVTPLLGTPTSGVVTNLTGAFTGVTSMLNAALYVGRDSQNTIDFGTDNNIIFKTNNVAGALIGVTGELDMNANSIGFTLQTLTGDGTDDIDWKLGNKMQFTCPAGDETFTFTAPTNPCNLLLEIIQDGVGGRDITFPANVKWLGTEPTWSDGGASKTIVMSMWYNGTNYWSQGTNWEA